jgi:acyl transferase domain-containing protein
LTALHWAGAYDAVTLMRVTVARGQLMGRSRGGAMCHIVAPISELYWVMEPNPKVVVSCINGPDSTVLSGPVAAIEAMDQVATSADLCIEVGSGSNLSHFVAGWLDLPVLPLDVAGDTIDGLMQVLATAYVHGADIDPTALTAGPPAVIFKDLSSPIQTDGAGHPAWGAEHRAGGCWSPMLS